MKISELQAALSNYNPLISSSFARELKSIAESKETADRDLNDEELVQLTRVMLKASSNNALGVDSKALYTQVNTIRDKQYDNYARICLSISPKTWNKAALLKAKKIKDTSNLSTRWYMIPSDRRTEETLHFLVSRIEALTILKELLPSMESQALFLQHLETLIAEHYQSTIPNYSSLPDFIKKPYYMEKLIKIPLEYFVGPDQPMIMRVDDMEDQKSDIISALLKTFCKLPEEWRTTTVFDTLCKMARYDRNFDKDTQAFYSALIRPWRTHDNYAYYLTAHRGQAAVKALHLLSAEFQTEETFLALIDLTKRLSTSAMVIEHIKKWNRLPAQLKTTENLKLYLSKHGVEIDQYNGPYILKENAAHHLSQLFDSLPFTQKNQATFEAIFNIRENCAELARRINATYFRINALSSNLTHHYIELIRNDAVSSKTKIQVLKAIELIPVTIACEALFSLFLQDTTPEKRRSALLIKILLFFDVSVLTRENMTAIMQQNPFPSLIFNFINRLDTDIKHKIKHQTIFDALLRLETMNEADSLNLHTQINAINRVFDLIPADVRLRFATEANYTFISANSVSIMRDSNVQGRADALGYGLFDTMHRLPAHLFTQQLLDTCILCLITPSAQSQAVQAAAIRANVQRLLQANEPDPQRFFGQDAEEKQSTHTATVHKSVSESALKLMARYGMRIHHDSDLLSEIESFKTAFEANYTNSTDFDALMYQAAQRCVSRLIQPHMAHTDAVSQVSTLQLLALIWIAIHDAEVITAPYQDAYAKLIKALYETQRGYNISDKNIDNDSNQDLPICVGGTFNKIMEALWSIHPDVTIVYMTKTTASYKVSPLTVELVNVYFKQALSEAKTDAKQSALIQKLQTIEQEGCLFEDEADPLWKRIRPRLADNIIAEFKQLYKNENDPELMALIDNGLYANASLLNVRLLLAPYAPKEEKAQPDMNKLSANTVEDSRLSAPRAVGIFGSHTPPDAVGEIKAPPEAEPSITMPKPDASS